MREHQLFKKVGFGLIIIAFVLSMVGCQSDTESSNISSNESMISSAENDETSSSTQDTLKECIDRFQKDNPNAVIYDYVELNEGIIGAISYSMVNEKLPETDHLAFFAPNGTSIVNFSDTQSKFLAKQKGDIEKLQENVVRVIVVRTKDDGSDEKLQYDIKATYNAMDGGTYLTVSDSVIS